MAIFERIYYQKIGFFNFIGLLNQPEAHYANQGATLFGR